jgi:hypothetical protein
MKYFGLGWGSERGPSRLSRCIGSTRAKLYAFCHISAVRMRDSRIVAELSWQIRTRPTSNRSKHPNQPKHYSARVRESSTRCVLSVLCFVYLLSILGLLSFFSSHLRVDAREGRKAHVCVRPVSDHVYAKYAYCGRIV